MQAAMALASGVVSHPYYPLFKLTVLEEGFREFGLSEKADAIRVGIFKVFEMMEIMSGSNKEDPDQDYDRDPDLDPIIPET